MLYITKTDENNEAYQITFDSDEIRSILMYHYENEEDYEDEDDYEDGENHEEPTLEYIRGIAEALSDMFDDVFSEWVLA